MVNNMKHFRITLFLIIFSILISGCQKDPGYHQTSENNHETTNTSFKKAPVSQEASQKAKKILNQKDGVSKVQAINDDDQLVIAVAVPHMQRFKLESTTKKLDKQMKKHFPDQQVTLSTDKKIYLELEQLKKQMDNQQLSKETLNKKLQHIIKLSDEKT